MLRDVLVVGVLLVGSAGVAGAQNGSDVGPDTTVMTADEMFDELPELTEGTNVRLENGVVRAKSGNTLLLRFGKHEIFVVPNDPTKLDFIAIGARVHVQGTLRRPPTAPQAHLTYAMRMCDASHLAHTRFYVDAWSLSAAG